MAEILKIPGMPNLHSHAFQRAMAGLTERQTNPEDSFWTWRELMYRFASRITPEQLYVIAAQAYLEMLEVGYTSVCEFHYLHHQPNGQPYLDCTEMSQSIIKAAQDVGIRLTLLPTLYMTGGFDQRALSDRQKRFAHQVDYFLELLRKLKKQEHASLKIGAALHSLRAVPETAIREVSAAVANTMPIHIHIAEQMAEVKDCLQVRGARPVQWLMDHFDVDQNWTLVHATHVNAAELDLIAKSKANVAICPSTEANLGDGIFELREFIRAGGKFGIGSDSNSSISPIEELRWLEYMQRLQLQQRNIAVNEKQASVGEFLWQQAVRCGGAALQQDIEHDYLVLNAQEPALAAVSKRDVYDRLVFSGNRNLVKDVFVANTQVVFDGRHPRRDEMRANYFDVLQKLQASV
jgi:formimidoylglutamate deiminase